MTDKFVVVSTDRDGKASLIEVIGAEPCALLIIHLVHAGHTGISNGMADQPKPVVQPHKPAKRIYRVVAAPHGGAR